LPFDIDMERLTEVINDAVITRLGGTVPPCSCHQLEDGRCPDVMRPLVAGGVSRFGLTAAAFHAGLASLIDHTLLKPDATEGQIRELCSEAAEFHFATVCVQPTWVRLSAETLRGTGGRGLHRCGFSAGSQYAERQVL
jgi:hypothetical protein